MKLLLGLLSFLACMSCATPQKKMKQIQSINEGNCPSNGTCLAQKIPNKGIAIKEDEFGKTFIELIDKTDSWVMHYEYQRNKSPENYADDFYKEEIYMEVPNDNTSRTYVDEALKDVKLIFGRFCYCKGSAGYFQLTQGKLKVDHSHKETNITLDFKASVPQVLTTIHYIFPNK